MSESTSSENPVVLQGTGCQIVIGPGLVQFSNWRYVRRDGLWRREHKATGSDNWVGGGIVSEAEESLLLALYVAIIKKEAEPARDAPVEVKNGTIAIGDANIGERSLVFPKIKIEHDGQGWWLSRRGPETGQWGITSRVTVIEQTLITTIVHMLGQIRQLQWSYADLLNERQELRNLHPACLDPTGPSLLEAAKQDFAELNMHRKLQRGECHQ